MKKRVQGFVKVQASVVFGKIKQNDRFWTWLRKNQVFVRTTTLSQSRHANLGWLLGSHPEYTCQTLAVSDLRKRMTNKEVEFELIPHQISHTTQGGSIIKTKALKLRSNYDDREEVMNQVMRALAKGEEDEALTSSSNTRTFKLIPFMNSPLSVSQTTTAIHKQNAYLHDVKAISVVNLGDIGKELPKDGDQSMAG